MQNRSKTQKSQIPRKTQKPRKSRKTHLNKVITSSSLTESHKQKKKKKFENKKLRNKGFRVFILSPIPKSGNSEIRKFYKIAIIRKYKNVASKTVPSLFK